MKYPKIETFKKEVEAVRIRAKAHAEELALYTGLPLKSLRYLTIVNLIDWHCDSIFIDGFSAKLFRELVKDLRNIAYGVVPLACEDYFAT